MNKCTCDDQFVTSVRGQSFFFAYGSLISSHRVGRDTVFSF